MGELAFEPMDDQQAIATPAFFTNFDVALETSLRNADSRFVNRMID